MARKIIMSHRIDPSLKKRFQKLAKDTDRSMSWLIQQAIFKLCEEQANGRKR